MESPIPTDFNYRFNKILSIKKNNLRGYVKIYKYNNSDWIQLGNNIYGEYENNNFGSTDYSVQLADGLTYSISKEKNGYVLKKLAHEGQIVGPGTPILLA